MGVWNDERALTPGGGEARSLDALLRALTRYRVGAVFTRYSETAAAVNALRQRLPTLRDDDLLSGVTGKQIERLTARSLHDLTAGEQIDGPRVVRNLEALLSTLAADPARTALTLLSRVERPPHPRVLVLHSPYYVDRVRDAFGRARVAVWTDNEL